MVYTKIASSTIKAAYPDIKKDKNAQASSVYHQQTQQSPKNDKYGSWGPIYKNKQNFVDMHIC